jgi:hypothetical protein
LSGLDRLDGLSLQWHEVLAFHLQSSRPESAETNLA